MISVANKQCYKRFCDSSNAGERSAVDNFFAVDAVIEAVHPFNTLDGPRDYQAMIYDSLQQSFSQLVKAPYITIGGSFDSNEWVASTGYYRGNFEKHWLGIKPTGAMAFLRYAEFHRMEQERAVESYIYFDIPALMMDSGVWPVKHTVASHAGYRGYLPGPSTSDGLVWQATDPNLSAETLALTETMLLNLATEDESWRPYWHNDMTWYGPAVFGAFHGIEEFSNFQTPFEQTFSEWISGIMPGSKTRHFLRMADGDYSCLGGWPSLNMVQVKPFLGIPPGSERLYMRVCDFWRRDGDKLAENWVFVDMLHFLLQLDYDVLAEASEKA